jgi:hypothetical protein
MTTLRNHLEQFTFDQFSQMRARGLTGNSRPLCQFSCRQAASVEQGKQYPTSRAPIVTIVNVALSRISADFGATVAELQSVIDGYTLGFAALLLSAGVVVDRLGSKRVFVTGFFLVNIPICAFGLALTLRCVPPTQRDKRNQRSFDLAGQALAILTRPDRSAAQLASQRLVLW